jgi:solute carrier family 25 phosphate transporter 3
VDPARFKSIPVGFNLILAEQGAKGLFKGWAPTAIGYSAQGACKFGFYEFFKKCVAVACMRRRAHAAS